MKKLFALAGVAGLCLAGCGVTRAAPLRADGARPILYLDVKSQQLVVKAVYTNGRQLSTPLGYDGGMPTWSPDGNWLTYATRDPGGQASLRLTSLQGTTRSLFTTGGDLITAAAWSPDGREIALVLLGGPPSTATIAVLGGDEGNLASSHPLAPSAATAGAHSVRWSPDGRKILVSGGMAVVIHVDTKDVETIADKPVLAEWAPGSDAVYYCDLGTAGTGSGDFYLKRLGSAAPIKLTAWPEASGWQRMKSVIALSPRGSRLAIAWSAVRSAEGSAKSAASEVRLYDVAGGRSVQPDRPAKSYRTDDLVLDLQWSPDEDGLAAVAAGRQHVDIRFLDLLTGAWRTLAAVTGNDAVLALYLAGHKTMSWTR